MHVQADLCHIKAVVGQKSVLVRRAILDLRVYGLHRVQAIFSDFQHSM